MPTEKIIFVCSCEDTMPLDAEAIAHGSRDAEVRIARHLCGSELERFREAAQNDQAILIGCKQQVALFSEEGEDARLAFVNLRETAGWSNEAADAGPKMAALLAAAQEETPAPALVSMESEGVVLIYGRDEKAIELGELLKDKLDVTVMLREPREVAVPRAIEFPVVKGTVRNAKGHLGDFELTVDSFAQPAASSRTHLQFGTSRNGATSRCDIVIDISGGSPLFPAPDLRDGYLRADPNDPAAVLRAAFRAADLVGTFDKPRYIAFSPELCAHSRSRIVGCQRCLDLCPTGALTPAGDHVSIDVYVCAGCGSCAAACPTGAALYDLPRPDVLLRKLRAALLAYRSAGGRHPVLLLHDEAHGVPLIDALARHGDGLPAHVIPIAVNETTQVGIEVLAAAFAFGASAVHLLVRGRARHDITGLHRTVALAEPILSSLGYGVNRVRLVEADDPAELGAAVRADLAPAGTQRPATFSPAGGKRDVLRQAMRELHHAAPTQVDRIELPAGAPFGAIQINVEGCTLCLSCVSACPTGALGDDPERPTVRFTEDACVQCGLCAATCPEKVITLQPQLDFAAWNAPPRVIKQEEPFRCIQCDKPFGTRSTIERVIAKLEGRHWMYKSSGTHNRLDIIRMCDDCRVGAVTAQDFDPYGAPARPAPRTTEDYLRERAALGEEPLG
ncbi:MAG: hypothetical protein QOD74_1550 [Variibacter sp.]|jgi:ferredoxin|nr:hypothetical protein [Variibacter sp.]